MIEKNLLKDYSTLQSNREKYEHQIYRNAN